MPDMTGRPGCRCLEEVPRRTSCVPLASPYLCLFSWGCKQTCFRLPGAGGEHFHCTVDPSPGHIRRRVFFLCCNVLSQPLRNRNNLGELKGTELRWQREPKTQIFAENRRFSQIRPFSCKFQHLEGAGNRRFSQETEDFRRELQGTADWALWPPSP